MTRATLCSMTNVAAVDTDQAASSSQGPLVRKGSRAKSYRSVSGVPVVLLLALRSMEMMLLSLGTVSCTQGG